MPQKNTRYLLWFLYLLSGFSGLVYEVVWVRLFGLKFGVNSLAVGSVLAAFMLGLAFGGYFFGRLSDRYRNPIRLYALLELGVCLYALSLPYLLDYADKIYLGLAGSNPDFAMLAMGRFLLALIILFPVTALMGGTLPALTKYFVKKIEALGSEIAYLYGINILGAVLGCFSAGFLFIGSIGVAKTNYIAAALNFIVAAIAFILSLKSETDAAPSIKEETERPKETLSPSWLYPIIFIVAGAGFTSLIYEILWHRILALMLRNTVYAFCTMLTTFLAGLFLGSILAGKFSGKEKKSIQILGLLEIGIGLYALAIIPILGKLNEIFCYLEIDKGIFGHSWALFAAGQFLLCAGVMLLPALMMGMIFPLACKLYFLMPKTEKMGRGIGRIYALNTLGAVAGSFAGSFLLIPWIGTQGSIILAAGINLILGFAVILKSGRELSLDKRWAGVIGILLILAGVGASYDITFRQAIEYAGEEIIYRQEDSSSLIEVTRKKDDGTRMLVSNRQQQEGDSSWLSVSNQREQVYLPLFLHPDPKKVLGIGLGTGISFAACSHYPLELAECAELSPGVIEAVRYFANENENITDNPKIKVIEADGRNYMRLTQNKYDVIIADLFSSYGAGVGNLYSREHYLQCKAKLNKNGIMCQWLPPHQLPGDTLKIVAKTFQSVFPHTSLWLTRQAIALIATTEPLRIDHVNFSGKFSIDNVREDLKISGLDNPYTFLNNFVMGEERLAEFTKDVAINTDDNPLVEFKSPKEFYRLIDRSLFDEHAAQVNLYRESIFPYLSTVSEAEVLEKLEQNYMALWHSQKGENLADSGRDMEALDEFRESLKLDPSNASARRTMGKYYLSQGRQLFQSGLFNEAVPAYKRALEMIPINPQAHYGLGEAYYYLGDLNLAREEFTNAKKIDPYLKLPNM